MSYPSFRQLLHIIEDDIRPKKRFWGQNGTIQQLQGDFVRGARLASLIAGAALMAGVLICMEKPSEKDCKEAGVDSRKFFCARQHQYGLNMQAVCDADRRCFLDVSIRNLAATSDYLSFATSELNHSNLRRDRFLVDGIALYGDAAYVNYIDRLLHPLWHLVINCVWLKSSYNSMVATSGGSILSKLEISKKIVGRDDEIERLQNIYCKIRDEVPTQTKPHSRYATGMSTRSQSVFVEGVSGIGKSALVKTAFAEMVEMDDHGYYVEGKFDLRNSHLPFSAIAAALVSLCSKVLRSDDGDKDEVTSLRQKIKDTFDDDDQAVLGGLLPNLIVADDVEICTPARSNNNSDGHHSMKNTFFRLKKLVVSLVKILVGDRVLTMFIDDLQWANVGSLELIDELVAKLSPTKFLFVGGFRSDEVLPDDYLMEQLVKRPKDPPVVISIGGLQMSNVATFLADTLKKEQEIVTPLAELIYEETDGNMFFVKQYIGYLYHNGHIYSSLQNFGWEWEDLATIQDACTVEDGDVEAVVSKKILRMPAMTVTALKLASCIGGRFDLSIIDFVLQRWCQSESSTRTLLASEGVDQQPIEEIMWPAVEEGLLEEVHIDSMSFSATVHYKFAHDKVQSAAYALLGAGQVRYHLAVGTSLEDLYRGPVGQPWMVIFAADNIYQGERLLKSQHKRDEAADLHYVAAQELQANSEFLAAAEYLRNALKLLGEGAWTREYDLTLKVSDLSAKMENAFGVQAQCEKRVQDIMDNASCLDDQETAYYVKMSNLSSMQHHGEAMQTGLVLLRKKKMGWIPKHIGQAVLAVEVLSTLRQVKNLSDGELLGRANAVDERVAGYLRATIEAMICSWFANQWDEFVFLTMRAVKISLKYGYSSNSPTAFVIFGNICANLKKFRECERLGNVGVRLLARFSDPQADILTRFQYTIADHLFTPIQGLSERYCEIHSTALRHCNVGVACMASGTRSIIAYLNGAVPLDKFVSICAQYRDEMIAYNKLKFLPVTRMGRQMALNMGGRNRRPSVLEGGEIKDLQAFREEIKHDPYSLRFCGFYSMQLAYMFGDLDQAIVFARSNLRDWKVDLPTFPGMYMPFYRGLIWCSAYKRYGLREYKRFAKRELKIFQDWAKADLSCRRAFSMFLEAEIMALVEQKTLSEVKAGFELLLAELERVGMDNITALGAERAGMYFKDVDEQLSFEYFERSNAAYGEWRANGKVRQVKKISGSLFPGTSTAGSIGDRSGDSS